jgi:hypothetical protein
VAREDLEKVALYLLKTQKQWLQERAHALTRRNGRRVTESEVARDAFADGIAAAPPLSDDD